MMPQSTKNTPMATPTINQNINLVTTINNNYFDNNQTSMLSFASLPLLPSPLIAMSSSDNDDDHKLKNGKGGCLKFNNQGVMGNKFLFLKHSLILKSGNIPVAIRLVIK